MLGTGSCTLAIVMLNFFNDGELPGGVEGPFASRDVTSFYELWQAASKIEAVCLLHAGKPGWAAEGMCGVILSCLFETFGRRGKEPIELDLPLNLSSPTYRRLHLFVSCLVQLIMTYFAVVLIWRWW